MTKMRQTSSILIDGLCHLTARSTSLGRKNDLTLIHSYLRRNWSRSRSLSVLNMDYIKLVIKIGKNWLKWTASAKRWIKVQLTE